MLADGHDACVTELDVGDHDHDAEHLRLERQRELLEHPEPAHRVLSLVVGVGGLAAHLRAAPC
jgi:hypothetical protein